MNILLIAILAILITFIISVAIVLEEFYKFENDYSNI